MTDVNSAGVAVPVDWRALLLVRGERWVESRTGLLAAVEYRSLWSLGDRRLAIDITVHPRSPAAGVLDRARVRLFAGTRWHTIVRLPEELLEVSVTRAELGHFRWQEGRLLWEALVVLGADPASLPPETRLAWLLYASEAGEAPVDPADDAVPIAVRRAAPWTVPLDTPASAPSPSNGDRPAAAAGPGNGRSGSASIRAVRHARPADAAAGRPRPDPGTNEPAGGDASPAPPRPGPPVRIHVDPGVTTARESAPAHGRPASSEPARGARRPPRAQPSARASEPAAPGSVPTPPPADVDPLPWQGAAPALRPRRLDAPGSSGSSFDGGSVLGSIGEAVDHARERVTGALERLELQREAARSFGWTRDGRRPGPLWGPESAEGAGPYDWYDGGPDDRSV